MLEVLVLGGLGAAGMALEVEFALGLEISLLGGEERDGLLIVGTRHCAGDVESRFSQRRMRRVQMKMGSREGGSGEEVGC